MGEELAVALRSQERRRDDVPGPEADGPGMLDDAFEDLAMDRRVADDAVVGAAAAGLELRLHERDDVAARPEGRGDRGEDEVERDERDVDRREADRFGQGRGCERAGIRALHRDHARVAAQRFGELAAADVERIHARRATLQQHVGEPAGRRPDVEAHETGRIDPEGVQAGGELVATAADVGLGGVDLDARRRVDQVAGLAIVPGGIALPHPDLARQHEGLGATPRLDQPALHEQLIEPDPRGLRLRRGTTGRTHPPIVAQPASPGLTRSVATGDATRRSPARRRR